MSARDRVVMIYVSSFRGISVGAVHWYGSLHGREPYKRFELTRTLSAEDAQKLNAARREDCWHDGSRINGFDTPADVLKAGRAVWKRKFPGADILLSGHYASADPEEPIDGPEAVLKQLRDIWERFHDLGNNPWGSKTKDEAERLFKRWHRALRLKG